MGGLRWCRRRWRSLTATLVTLLLVLASLGIWFSRFPAETESVAGPPLELEVQDGVPRAEVEQVRAGLTAMDAYLRDEVGSAVSRPVQVRVSWSHRAGLPGAHRC